MDEQQKLEQLKLLSIRKERLRQKVNELRKQKAKIESEIDDLVTEMILAD
jgi:hypothetical protein